jgi:CPA2 family monovalent cation:H+ antiporter-2
VIVLLPIIAVTQPFLPGVPGAVVLAVVVLLLGVGFWRSAANLQGHVRAGALVLVEALAKQGAPAAGHAHAAPGPDPLGAFRTLFPGLGDPVAVRLRDQSPAAGRSLSSLGVRGETGATVLAIFRGERSVMLPAAAEVLEPRDLLVLAGTRDAVDAARELLAADPAAAPAGPLPEGSSAA